MKQKKSETEIAKSYRSSADIALAIHERLESTGASDLFCLTSGVVRELASGEMGVRDANAMFNGIGKLVKLMEVQQRYGAPGKKDDQVLRLLLPPIAPEDHPTEDARDAEIAELRTRVGPIGAPGQGCQCLMRQRTFGHRQAEREDALGPARPWVLAERGTRGADTRLYAGRPRRLWRNL